MSKPEVVTDSITSFHPLDKLPAGSAAADEILRRLKIPKLPPGSAQQQVTFGYPPGFSWDIPSPGPCFTITNLTMVLTGNPSDVATPGKIVVGLHIKSHSYQANVLNSRPHFYVDFLNADGAPFTSQLDIVVIDLGCGTDEDRIYPSTFDMNDWQFIDSLRPSVGGRSVYNSC